MKKALAVILTLILVIGMLPIVGVSAVDDGNAPTPATQEIKTASDFIGIDLTGSYTLGADITLDTTLPGKFTGTLDGKGHTITTSAPIFQEIDGTVSNLKIKGTINKAGDNAGALSVDVLGGTYTDITNEADVTAEKSAGGLFGWAGKNDDAIVITNFTNTAAINGTVCAGGAIGNSAKGVKVDFTNCNNTGAVTGKGDSTGGLFGLIQSAEATPANVNFTLCSNSGVVDAVADTPGGLAGYGQGYAKINFKNCINTAEVKRSETGSDFSAGGMLGHSSGESHFENCINLGNITNVDYKAGGIVGYVNDSAYFKNCVNMGNITGATNAAGIAGRVSDTASFEDCINTGKIVAGNDTGSGIVGHLNGTSTFKNCYNTGDVSSNDCMTGIGGFSGKNTMSFNNCYNIGKLTTGSDSYDSCALYYISNGDAGTDVDAANIVNCFYLENCAEYERHYGPNGKSTVYVPLDAAKSLTAAKIAEAKYDWNMTDADIASGKLCYYVNQIAGENIFYQTLGTDATPTVDNTHGTVYKVGETFSNSPDTSDVIDMTAVIVVAVVAVLGMGITAVALKRRVND